MIKLNATNLEELEQELNERATEVSVEVVKNVCKALEAGADKVSLAIISQLNMDLSVHRGGYLESLTVNLHRCELAEEFELCQEAQKWIKILEDERKETLLK